MQANGEAQLMAADPKVTAYQVAARIYCEVMGENPDAVLSAPHPTLAGVSVSAPYWYGIAGRMYELAVMLRCISEQNKRLQPAANAG